MGGTFRIQMKDSKILIKMAVCGIMAKWGDLSCDSIKVVTLAVATIVSKELLMCCVGIFAKTRQLQKCVYGESSKSN